jgi:hypothetical protein
MAGAHRRFCFIIVVLLVVHPYKCLLVLLFLLQDPRALTDKLLEVLDAGACPLTLQREVIYT